MLHKSEENVKNDIWNAKSEVGGESISGKDEFLKIVNQLRKIGHVWSSLGSTGVKVGGCD